MAVLGSYVNGGQDCTAATRLIAHESVYDRFVKRVVEKSRQFRLDNPLERGTDMGPWASEAQRSKVKTYVGIGIAEGAKLLLR